MSTVNITDGEEAKDLLGERMLGVIEARSPKFEDNQNVVSRLQKYVISPFLYLFRVPQGTYLHSRYNRLPSCF